MKKIDVIFQNKVQEYILELAKGDCGRPLFSTFSYISKGGSILAELSRIFGVLVYMELCTFLYQEEELMKFFLHLK